MRRLVSITVACLVEALLPHPAQAASPLDGKSYMIEMSSSQSKSGYGDYLLPPLMRALNASSLKPAKMGTNPDVIFNIVTHSDVGQWMETSRGREWLYTQTITVGISPEAFSIPIDGTPQFGVAATLITPNSDREDELTCLVELSTREAIARYKPRGIIKISGQSCLRGS